MSKSYANIVDDVEAFAQDGGIDPGGSANQVFATAELDILMPGGLLAVSQSRPWQPPRITKTTTADSYDIALSAGDRWREERTKSYDSTGILKAEYLVDKNPPRDRGVSRYGNTLSLDVSSRPSSAVSVYLYMNKVHLLQKQIGTTDTAGAIKTLAAAGATSIILKSLGTGTIDEMTTIAIAGDSTVYYAIAQATIAANEATVSIWPPLTAAAAVDAVVTLSLTESTLDMRQEHHLARWLAARACIDKSTKYYSQVQNAITTLGLAVTATGLIAARLTQMLTDIASARTATGLGTTAITSMAARITQMLTDIASARTATGLGTTAIAAMAARITQAVADTASGRANIVSGTTAITEADTEADKIVTAVELARTTIVSAVALLNTLTVGGGAADYWAQANASLGEAAGRMSNFQSYLQKSSALFNNAAAYFNATAAETRASSEKAQEANANFANATVALSEAASESGAASAKGKEAELNFANATVALSEAAAEARAATGKAEESTANLQILASRLKISEGGVRYESWGRQEMAKVEKEIIASGGYPFEVRYSRD